MITLRDVLKVVGAIKIGAWGSMLNTPSTRSGFLDLGPGVEAQERFVSKRLTPHRAVHRTRTLAPSRYAETVPGRGEAVPHNDAPVSLRRGTGFWGVSVSARWRDLL